MSIIIPNMELPKGCFFCPLVGGDCRCRISHLDVSQHTMRRHDDCPLVELPDGCVNTAVKSLEAIQDIQKIINNTSYIQEDVIRYQAICEVIKEVTQNEHF